MKNINQEKNLKQSIKDSEQLFLSQDAQVKLVNILTSPDEPTQEMKEIRLLPRLKTKD